ncbi:hypothetical protein NC661_11410 [Aquibacillus koreensis]|uniref:Uncharacterized protein n=1 Tax=Aquibacillus koreensis TaxID=279446 RepID=A0A9X3WJM2_9BACI|nr:hypothetical protein [Aquibacillus koreensis]MCT2537676.1 hypothetical protein [Aquibacillus koreensis]MDC3420977.1 hypothetical protein [Aquibacillus koreensis]
MTKTRITTFVIASLFLIILTITTLSESFPPNLGSIGNPTAKEILDGNPDADILKLDGLIFSHSDHQEWGNGKEYTRGELIGEINNQTTNAWWFRNLYATKLPKGTKVHMPSEEGYEKGNAPFALVVEYEGQLLIYRSLREG